MLSGTPSKSFWQSIPRAKGGPLIFSHSKFQSAVFWLTKESRWRVPLNLLKSTFPVWTHETKRSKKRERITWEIHLAGLGLGGLALHWSLHWLTRCPRLFLVVGLCRYDVVAGPLRALLLPAGRAAGLTESLARCNAKPEHWSWGTRSVKEWVVIDLRYYITDSDDTIIVIWWMVGSLSL